MSSATRNATSVATESLYRYRSPMNATVYVGLQGAGVGFLVASIQTAFDKHSRGAMGVLTRSGGTIAFFAAMGMTFAFADAAMANTRQKNDAWNGAAAGCAIGLLAGARGKSIPAAAGACAAFATIIGSFDATGGRLIGIYSGETAEQKEERRRAVFKGRPPTDPLAT